MLPGRPSADVARERRSRHRLGPELAEQETGQLQACRVEQAGVGLGGLGECPPPALAVVLGFFKALGNPVIDRRAVRLDGCPAGLLATPITRTDSRRSRPARRAASRLWSRQDSFVARLPIGPGRVSAGSRPPRRDRGLPSHDPDLGPEAARRGDRSRS